MILKSFKRFFVLILICLSMSPLIGEEEIDIWKIKKQNLNEEDQQTLIQDQERFPQKIEKEKDKDVNNVIKIENNSIEENKKLKFLECTIQQNITSI